MPSVYCATLFTVLQRLIDKTMYAHSRTAYNVDIKLQDIFGCELWLAGIDSQTCMHSHSALRGRKINDQHVCIFIMIAYKPKD